MTINNNGFREGVYYDNDFENNIYKKVCYRNGAPIWEITIDRAIWFSGIGEENLGTIPVCGE